MHHIYAETCEKWLNERSSLNPLRISHPKIDKLACQTQGADIFAIGEIPLYDAYCMHISQFNMRESKRLAEALSNGRCTMKNTY